MQVNDLVEFVREVQCIQTTDDIEITAFVNTFAKGRIKFITGDFQHAVVNVRGIDVYVSLQDIREI